MVTTVSGTLKQLQQLEYRAESGYHPPLIAFRSFAVIRRRSK
jgi:hypothetical protein